MKKRCKILLVLVFQFLFAGFIHASEVWFINPSNGETMIHYTGYGTSATTIPVNLQYNQHFSTMYGGFVKLTDHNGVEHFSNQGNGIDQWWYLTPGTYTWKLDIYDFNLQGKYYWANSAEITFYVKHTLRVKNSFEGGNLKIDGETTTNGSSAYKFIGDNLGVGAIDQTYGGAQQVWNASGTNNSQWKIQRFGSGSINFLSYNRNYDYTVQNNDNAATIKGYYKVKPEVPQNLSVTANSNDHPLLSWTANTEPDLDKYNVYRKRSSPFIDWTLIGTASSNSYEDTGVNTSHHHGDDIYYKVTAVSTNNIESDYSNTVWIEARIEKKGIDNGNETAPKVYALNSNYPNPFNPSTTITYQIPKDGFVNLTVYNSLGQEVAVLVDQQQSVGRYIVQFNAAKLSSGIYFYRIASSEFNSVKKMLLVR